MSKAFSSPYPGYAVGLLGLLVMWQASAGFGGAVSCGTWSLDCGFFAVVATFVFQGVAATLLWVAVRRSVSRTPGRYLAILGGLAATLAALAAGGVLAFLAFAMMERGIL